MHEGLLRGSVKNAEAEYGFALIRCGFAVGECGFAVLMCELAMVYCEFAIGRGVFCLVGYFLNRICYMWFPVFYKWSACNMEY